MAGGFDVFYVDTLLLLICLCQGVALIAMVLAYGVSLGRRDLGWVDVGWTTGLAVAVLLCAFLAEGLVWRRVLVASLCAVWALRLTRHILRGLFKGEEDARYQALRRHWGEHAQRNALLLFLAESLLITLFTIPFLVVMRHPGTDFTGWDLAGLLIWLASVVGEWAADQQLHRFRSQPENRARTCREGLWRYSRHPNYFFEWTHWFAYVVMAVGAPYGMLAWLGPIVMFLFLYKVTGIPFAEKQALARRGQDYRNYQQTTSAFIPWFPRQEQPTS